MFVSNIRVSRVVHVFSAQCAENTCATREIIVRGFHEVIF